MSTSDIKALLATGSYKSESIPVLEKNVDAQINGSVPYDIAGNRSLAKLYQFFPTTSTSSDVYLARILILALMEYPSTDFLALLCLISEKVLETEAIASITRCFNLLDSCKFQEFWNEFQRLKDSNAELKSIAGASGIDMTQKFRSGIANVLAISYSVCPIRIVQVAFNTTSSDIIKGIPLVESVSKDMVIFPKTIDNTKRTKKFKEGVQFSSIAKLVAKCQ
eukprot:CAMPEP_0194140494 /NCGR_PEP_ID=MMETSP0152-20130528/10042_1 /TAXON_ID=1049557 /ORGANISM="Thalassiothrix antarctica, Strain L6-D1" /LENGTH=221 /DNA_ID=CAMNT_0038838763 /DNA_START=46 /DNA_END=711 /DNA_ORIENTATION=-